MNVIEHDSDFFLWTRQQADALRRLAETRPNAEIDWSNLIEEIEDLGNEQEHAIVSHLTVALVHLLKLAHSRDEQPRRHWMVEIAAQRGSLKRRLRKNPSLRARSAELLAEAYETAREEMSLYFDNRNLFPENCPFSIEQVLNSAWFPVAPLEGSVG